MSHLAEESHSRPQSQYVSVAAAAIEMVRPQFKSYKLQAKMKRACRKIWRSVPCTSRTSLRTDSRKDMEEILRTKLSTIKEEPELCEENLTPPRHMRMAKKQGKKIQAKDETGSCLVPHVNLKQSYVLFVTGFASKGTFGGFLQC